DAGDSSRKEYCI
nr:Chain B, Glycophorin C [Homo sapiens]